MTLPEPFVVAMMFPVEERPEIGAILEDVAPAVEVVWVPYIESSELRSAKGRHGGHDPTGLPTPTLDQHALAELARAHAIVGMDLPEAIADLAPNLRWFQGITAGHDHIDTADLGARGVVHTGASGIASASIAEFVMARVLEVWKHLRQLEAQQARREWQVMFGRQLEGSTMGIVGLGSIGREVARRARGFGVRVVATRGSAKPGEVDADADELRPADQVDELLPDCDVVVLALPATTASIDFMDARRIGLMKPGAVLVNVARGVHVVEADLIDALERGHLGAAILDVTREEPLPPDDPLWAAPNLYLSPHSAVSLDRYEASVVSLAVENLRAFLTGEPLRNVVPAGPDDASGVSGA